MIDNIQTFDRALKRLKFTEPVPGGIRQHASAAREKILANILKAEGSYNLFLRASLRVFFMARKTGMRLTVVQSAVAVTAASIAAAAGITAGSVAAVKNILPDKPLDAESVGIETSLPDEGNREVTGMSRRAPAAGVKNPAQAREEIRPERDSIPSKAEGPDVAIKADKGIDAGEAGIRKRRTDDSGTGGIEKTGHSYNADAGAAEGGRPAGKAGRGIDRPPADNSIHGGDNAPPGLTGNDGDKIAMLNEEENGIGEETPDGESGKNGEPWIRGLTFFIAADLVLNAPMGYFNEIAVPGPSLGISFGLKDILIKNFNAGIESGLYVFPYSFGDENDYGSSFLPMMVNLNYEIDLSKKNYIAPELIFGIASYSIDVKDLKEESGCPIGGAGFVFGYAFRSDINFYLRLRYLAAFLERETAGFISSGFGAELIF